MDAPTLVGATGVALACYSAYLIRFVPFVVLEGVWSAVAFVALVRRGWGSRAAAPGGRGLAP